MFVKSNDYRWRLLKKQAVLLPIMALIALSGRPLAQGGEPSGEMFLPVLYGGSSPPSGVIPTLVKDEFLVNEDMSGDDSHAVIAMTEEGEFAIAWHSDLPARGLDTLIRRFDVAGDPVTGNLYVNTTRARHQSNPAIDVVGRQLGIIAWSSLNANGEWDTMARLASGVGWLTGELQINAPSNASGPEPHPDVCMFKGGAYKGYSVVTWNDRISAGETTNYIRVLDPTGTPVMEPLQVNEVPSRASGALLAHIESLPPSEQQKFGFPAIACRPPGEVILLWERLGDQGIIVARRIDLFGDPVAWSSEIVVDAPGANVLAQRRPRISANASGDFVIAWSETPLDDPSNDLELLSYARTFGAVNSGRITLAAGQTEGNALPVVLMQSDSTFVAAWTHLSTASESGVWMQAFSPLGIPLGPPDLASFVPGGTTPREGLQRRASIGGREIDGALEVVVGWESNHSGAGSFDIYARIFRWQPSTSSPGLDN